MHKNKILILTLVVLMITAASCGSKTEGSLTTTPATSDASSNQTTVSSGASSGTTVAAPTVSTSASTTASVPDATEVFAPDADFDAILDSVLNLEVGTAGSSLKQASVAGSLLDWAQGTKLKQEGIEAQITYYVQSLANTASVDQFTSNFATVSDTVQLIIKGNSSAVASVADSGYTLAYSKYTQAKWDTFTLAIQVVTDAY